MTITPATDAREWDGFLVAQQYRPFLQSWTMGEVYRRIGQEPIRLIIKDGDAIKGICFGHIVPARRGRHLSIPYGPVLERCDGDSAESCMRELLKALARVARESSCSFIRMSPFWKASGAVSTAMQAMGAKASPLHLLAEHVWYLPLVEPDPWSLSTFPARSAGGHFPCPSGRRALPSPPRSEENIFKDMRATTRNLIRRAEKEGVTVSASADPVADLPLFLKLHEETRKRHGFTPYTDSFFRAQVEEFAKTDCVTLYVARHAGDVLATSIHMHMGGETSYHHGASVISKIPASTLLQWTAIKDALRRGDHVYNFWGIAPVDPETSLPATRQHPFAGVTLFKTGFGGNLLELAHCVDIPISGMYYVTRAFELARKWKRGF